jgi:hypothetical protein
MMIYSKETYEVIKYFKDRPDIAYNYVSCENPKIRDAAIQIILKYPEYALKYTKNFIGKKYKKAEQSISKDVECSVDYAKLIKNRFPKGEKTIIGDTEFSYHYAKDIMNGRLPENMHNAMIAKAIENSNDIWVKKYFKLLNHHT